jgi:hypothetical protein
VLLKSIFHAQLDCGSVTSKVACRTPVHSGTYKDSAMNIEEGKAQPVSGDMLAWYAWRLMPTIGPCLSMLPLLLQAYLQCGPVVDSLLNSCLRLSSAAQRTWLQNLNYLLNLLGQGPASGEASSTNRTRCSYDSAPKLVAVSMHLSCCLTP